jgi:hypothetical protein
MPFSFMIESPICSVSGDVSIETIFCFPTCSPSGRRAYSKTLNTLVSNRDILMRTVFYPYVSSRADTPLVEKHDIERALDAWSWYWLLVEAIPLSLLGALVAAALHRIRY